MFGNDSLPSKIYSYGAKFPHVNADLIDEQILLKHRYWNKLTELELARREQIDAAVQSLHPDVKALADRWQSLGQRIEDIRKAVKDRKAKVRGKVDVKAERAQIAELSAERKSVYADLKAAKQTAFADPAFIAGQEQIEGEHNAAAKSARSDSGLYWGNYLQVEQSAGSMRCGAPPEFRRWRGTPTGGGTDGAIAVQIQGGLGVDELFGNDSRVRVRVDDTPRTGKRGPWATLQIRVGSDGRKPIFASMRFRLHRPLPDGSLVKWVYVTRRMISTHAEWRVQFVVSKSEGFPKTDACNVGSVGIDVGWRLVPDGLRVAYWVGDDGREGQLILPLESLGRWKKAQDLRAIQDLNFNPLRDRLADWIKTNPVPDWLVEQTEALRQWRSANRLSAVVTHWRDNRFDGDEAMFAEAESWRKQHRHLYDWEGFQRIKAARWRDDVYRNFAAKMRRLYKTAFIEKMNVSKMRQTPSPEQDAIDGALVQYRNIASAGRLLQLVSESMRETVRCDAANTTKTCHSCGHVEKVEDLMHTCGECGDTWDQDRNAALNLLHGASAPVA